MKVQMEDRLSRLLADIRHDTVAFQTQILGNLCDHRKDVTDNRLIFRGNLGNRSDMRLGNHEKMGRSLGIDVIECVAQVIFVDFFGRDLPCCDFTRTDNP